MMDAMRCEHEAAGIGQGATTEHLLEADGLAVAA